MTEKLPLLLLPGLLCDARLWRDQVAALAPLAAPLVADLTLDDSIEKMASRAIAAIDGPFAVAGQGAASRGCACSTPARARIPRSRSGAGGG